jgi:hypothetical protein
MQKSLKYTRLKKKKSGLIAIEIFFNFILKKLFIKGNFVFLLILQVYNEYFTCLPYNLTLNLNGKGDIAKI